MSGNHPGSRSYLVAPHRTLAVLDRVGPVLPGPDADRVLDPDHEDLAVTDLAVAGPPGHRQLVDDDAHDLRLHDGLDLEAGAERDVHRLAAIRLGVAALRSAAFDLGHRDARNPALVQHVLDLLQALVADDRDHHLHRHAASVARHAGEASCCAAGACSGERWGLTVGVSA